MMEQEYYDINSPLFLLNEEIESWKLWNKKRNILGELILSFTDSDLMNMIIDKKNEDPVFYKKLIFKLEFELRRRKEEKYGESGSKKTLAQMQAELEEKKRLVSISDVISSISGMQINSIHKNYRCPLPDHKKDNTPSFHIYENTGSWRCFGCQKGGSAIDFIMEYNKVDVSTAIKLFTKNF